MSLAAFIQHNVLRPRIKKAGCLVVYDPAKLYRDVVADLADEHVTVVDASERGIESREQALESFVSLAVYGGGGPTELVIYVPTNPPKSDHERAIDPYAAYAAGGGMFPDGDDKNIMGPIKFSMTAPNRDSVERGRQMARRVIDDVVAGSHRY